MDWALFSSLFLFTLTGSVTPGPNNIILMSSGMTFGFRKTVPYIMGVAIGFASLMIAAVLGLGAIVQAIPGLLLVVTIAGATWLAWLAIKYFKTAALLYPANGPGAAAQKGGKLRARPFKAYEAALFQWVNPKGLIFAFGAAAGFIGISDNIAVRAIIMSGLFMFCGLIGNTLWAFAGSTINRLLSGGKWAVFLNVIMGVVILATAIFILISGLKPH